MSRMSEKEKFKVWLEQEKANGLVDFKFTPSWLFRENVPPGLTVEDICRDLNKINEAISQGKTRRLTAVDFGEEESIIPLQGV